MGITNAFDNTTEEILKPSHMSGRLEGFPETVVVTFSSETLNIILANNKTEIIDSMYAGIEIPIYKTEYKGASLAFFLTWLGGPATVSLLEEVIARRASKILLFGSCGSLDSGITDGHIVVPTFAYRDEGTSYHYVPESTGDYIEVKTAGRLLSIMDELGVHATAGRTWTTDGLFRETRKNMELRKKEGCITVEMECACVMAMAQFRQVEAYQFLYTADNLGGEEWDPRILGSMPDGARERYVRIAFETAARL